MYSYFSNNLLEYQIRRAFAQHTFVVIMFSPQKV